MTGGDEGNESGRVRVWLASERTLRSATKIPIKDDRGPLVWGPEGLTFHGSVGDRRLPPPRRLRLVRATLRWPWLVGVMGIAVLATFLFAGFNAAAAPALIASSVGAAVGLAVGRTQRWLQIDVEEDGEQARLYVAAAPEGQWMYVAGPTLQRADALAREYGVPVEAGT